MDKEVRDKRSLKSSWKDLESWAAYNCNTDVEAQKIMNARIFRECLILQSKWTDRDRERRGPHIAPIPWTPPSSMMISNVDNFKRLTNGENE